MSEATLPAPFPRRLRPAGLLVLALTLSILLPWAQPARAEEPAPAAQAAPADKDNQGNKDKDAGTPEAPRLKETLTVNETPLLVPETNSIATKLPVPNR
ncbi:MAG TPA: hypothetical protein VMM92_10190, partial [Thermoanaerobaculia bacterium]|nr:hypothetical protein [Thermoanaerobaculia bacterium]